MGRKKLTDRVPYMERTISWNIRLEKEVVKNFLSAFHDERARQRRDGKTYFLNKVLAKLLDTYVEEINSRGEGDAGNTERTE